MIFHDRIDAGKKLAEALSSYQNLKNGIVIGLPRGGVPLAYEVAKKLHLPLDVVCPRKIGAPFNKEYAIGAITETGEGIFNQSVIAREGISEKYLNEEIEKETLEARHRLNLYRSGKPKRDLSGKNIILVDDGLATGSTMKAAIHSIQKEGVKQIIVAVPVSPPDTLDEIRLQVDTVICLHAPPFFQAVGQFFQDFRPTQDEEVIDFLLKTSDEI